MALTQWLYRSAGFPSSGFNATLVLVVVCAPEFSWNRSPASHLHFHSSTGDTGLDLPYAWLCHHQAWHPRSRGLRDRHDALPERWVVLTAIDSDHRFRSFGHILYKHVIMGLVPNHDSVISMTHVLLAVIIDPIRSSLGYPQRHYTVVYRGYIGVQNGSCTSWHSTDHNLFLCWRLDVITGAQSPGRVLDGG